jgi:hypothetical protein
MSLRLVAAVACCAVGAAVELPVTAVAVLPDGCQVQRSGTLPPGDGQIAALPAAAGLASDLLIDGRPAVGWRFELGGTAAVAPEARLLAARDALAVAETAVARARQHAELAQAVLAPVPAQPGQSPPGLRSAEELRAVEAFVLANRATARQALVLAEEARRAAQLAVEEALSLPAPVVRGGRIMLPASDVPRQVRLTYRLDGGWTPSYRAEVDGGRVRLVRLAEVRLPQDDVWGTMPLRLLARSAVAPVLLPDLPQATLGMPEASAAFAEPREAVALQTADVVGDHEMGGADGFIAIGAGGGSAGLFGGRSGGAKKRAVGRYGGSKGSESSVDTGARSIFDRQRSDGSWSDGSHPLATHGLCLLNYLGAGYDHKTPSKFKARIAKGMTWLRSQDLAHAALVELAIGTTVLAEAYAMTSDRDLRPQVEQLLGVLRQRAIDGGELGSAVATSGPLAGPEVAVWVTMAAKSSHAGGIDTGDLLVQLQDMLAGLALVGRDGDEGRLAGLTCGAFLGQRPFADPAEWSAWAGRIPRWLAEGRLELVYFTVLSAFQAGGDAWVQVNRSARDRLAVDLADGTSSSPWPPGGLAATALSCLSLEVYYRYAQVSPSTISSVVAPSIAWNGWPLELTTPPLHGVPGSQQVRIDARDLTAAAGLICVPLTDPCAWRRLSAMNPWVQALPGAPLEVVFAEGGTASAQLAFTRPGAPLRLDLGRDERVRVVRTAEVSTDEGWIRRTMTVRLRFACSAPAGTPAVEVIEPLPLAASEGEVAFTVVAPQLSEAELERLRRDDPFLRFTLAPGAERVLEYRFTYPTAVRPVLEYR